MIIRDQKLQQHCARATTLVSGLQSEQLQILGLLDAWQCFQLAEGQDSPRAAEAIEHLLSPELRPALRQWYQQRGVGMNGCAIRFRDRLSELAGETFG